jgi:acetoin utilization deacetylase AcuC-like enzyme
VQLAMPVVWSEQCRLHEPEAEIWVGLRTEAAEVAARLDTILETLRGAGGAVLVAETFPDEALRAVHDEALLAYLASAWDEWNRAGLPADPGQDRVIPYVFAHTALTRSPALPAAVSARPGYFAYDTMTLIGPGTWEAARGAADAALTAAELVLEGAASAYACCRPPGHHACRSCYGGSCYLNSAAVAAAALAERLGRVVAVLDLDAHHGNGTQEIFYERPDILVGSVHVNPGAGWFPHFLGFADEAGSGPGEGANRNLPLAPASGDDPWLEAVHELAAWAKRGAAAALVVPLGVDAAAGDPQSPLRVTPAGFREGGRILGGLGLPTVVVQEGGYDLKALGPLVLETLLGIEEALP